MIFDIAASIGKRRKYLMINGVEVSPFKFPTNFKATSSTFNYFDLVHHVDGAIEIVLRESTHGCNGYAFISIKNCFPDITEYNKLCFVISLEDFNSSGHFKIGLTSYNPSGSDIYELFTSSDNTLPNDGEKIIVELDITSFHGEANFPLFLGADSNWAFDEDSPPRIDIHHIYAE